jgi:8-oxo-dGTP pyrophosphatase MutT (NUDIX family)
VITKVVPVLMREKRGVREILAFRHPKAGLQIVKGTLEAVETLEAAALRELAEESGITGARVVRALGASVDIVEGQQWAFLLCEAGEQPARWLYSTADDGGLILSFFWQPLGEPLVGDWHVSFVRALDFVRERIRPG